MIKQLVKDILNFNEFMTEEERDNYIASVTAFGAMVLSNSNPKRKVREIVLGGFLSDDDEASAEAQTMGDNGFQIANNFFKKTSKLCANLCSVYHENSHIFNDPNQVGVNVTTFARLIRGELVHIARSEFDECMGYIHKYVAEDGELLLDDIPKDIATRVEQFLLRPQNVKGTIFRAYWNQPHEIRARMWGNAIVEELIRLAEIEQEQGNLSTVEEVNLYAIRSQLSQMKKEDRCIDESKTPPTKQDLERLKAQLLETREIYHNELDQYLESSVVSKMVMNVCRRTPNPVDYLTNSLTAYYDDKLAHELMVKCLVNVDRDSSLVSSIIELYAFTPIRFTDEERFLFENIVRNPMYVQSSDEEDIIDSIEEAKRHNEVCKQNYDALDPSQAESVFGATIEHMPNRSIAEFLDKAI